MGKFDKLATGLRDGYNKYFIFKNADRRKSLRVTNFFFNALFILCYVIFAVTFFWLIILFGLLGLFLTANYVQNMVTPAIILLVSAGVFVVFYSLKFVIEGCYIKNELKELNVDVELNSNQIAIAKVVGKVRVLALICTAIAIVLAGAAAGLAAIGQGIGIVIALVLLVVLFIVFKGMKIKMYSTVHDEIMAVMKERKDLKNLIK